MNKQKLWLWNGIKATEPDIDYWKQLQKIVMLNGRDDDLFREVFSHAEYVNMINTLQREGWQLDHENESKESARISLWEKPADK